LLSDSDHSGGGADDDASHYRSRRHRLPAKVNHSPSLFVAVLVLSEHCPQPNASVPVQRKWSRSVSELSMGWVDPWVGLGWVGLGRDFSVLVGWVWLSKGNKI